MTSFLRGFVDYCKSRTDAPEDYHIHGGLGSLGVACGANVYADGRGRNLYANLYQTIIGPSGSGKSVPLDISARLMKKAGLGARLFPESFSLEALYDEFKDEPTRILYSQEFSATMGMLNRDYMGNAPQLLTEIYDVPDEYVRKLRKSKDGTGVVRLTMPCLSILGATAPDWFAEQFKLSALRSGFLARFLFCPRTDEDRGPYVKDPGPFDDGAEAWLADHLARVATLKGRADFSRVMGYYDDWEKANREGLKKAKPDFAGMHSRAGAFVKKTAILFQVSEDPTHLQISAKALDQAIGFIEKTHRLAEVYLSTRVAHDRGDAERLRIRELLERAGGTLPWSTALRNSHLDARQLKAAVDTLEQSDVVTVEQSGRSKVIVLKNYLRVVS